MSIRLITIKELAELPEKDWYKNAINVPITPLRILSQYNNPRAKPDQVALVVAFNEHREVVSYMGCLPDELTHDPSEAICWCSCWWSHPEKGKNTTMQVFYRALQAWEGKMLFDALPQRSKEILERLKFVKFQEIPGVQAFLHFKFHKLITKRIPVLKSIRPVLKLGDQVLNTLYHLFKSTSTLSPSLEVKEIRELNDTLVSFIKSNAANEFVYENWDRFKWIKDFPWMNSLENGEGAFTDRYYFSTHANRFVNKWLEVVEDQQIIAFLWFTCRDGEVKLPYAYFETQHAAVVSQVVLHQLKVFKAETFICYHPDLLSFFTQGKSPFYHYRNITKTFGYADPLSVHFTKYPVIQDGDGDVVFT